MVKYTDPQEVAVAIHKPMAHHIHNLSYTATGYGSKIPTPWMLTIFDRDANRWNTHRVYAMVYGNGSVPYVLIKREIHVLDLTTKQLIEHEARYIADRAVTEQLLARADKALGE